MYEIINLFFQIFFLASISTNDTMNYDMYIRQSSDTCLLSDLSFLNGMVANSEVCITKNEFILKFD